MSNPWNLNAREVDVLNEMVKHGDNQKTADALGISFKTVDGLIVKIRRKMKVSNRVLMAVTWARQDESIRCAAPVTPKRSEIAALHVKAQGKASATTVGPLMPKLSHYQVCRALYEAERENLIHALPEKHERINGKGLGLSVYAYGPRTSPKPKHPPRQTAIKPLSLRVSTLPRVSSVWELGITQ